MRERISIIGVPRLVDLASSFGNIDLCIAPLFSEERPPRGLTALFDWVWDGRVSKAILSGMVSAEHGRASYLAAPINNPLGASLVLLGAGSAAKLDANRLSEWCQTALALLAKLDRQTVAVYFGSDTFYSGDESSPALEQAGRGFVASHLATQEEPVSIVTHSLYAPIFQKVVADESRRFRATKGF